MNRTPLRTAVSLILAAGAITGAVAGAAAANAATSTPAPSTPAPAASDGKALSARPLTSTDLSVSGSRLIALENSYDSTPTAAENESYADEWNIAAGCMAARGFYVDPTITSGAGTPAALRALNAPYSTDPRQSGCFALAQHLVGPRDPH